MDSRGGSSLSELSREKVALKPPSRMAKWATQPQKGVENITKNYEGAVNGEVDYLEEEEDKRTEIFAPKAREHSSKGSLYLSGKYNPQNLSVRRQ